MLIVILAAVVIGGVFAFLIWRNRKGAAASTAWPSVEGRVTTSTVVTRRDEGQLEYRPHIAFTYAVAGRSYTGERVRFGFTRYGQRPAADLCARYPVGTAVPVYYDPADPSKSVLEPGKKA